MSSAGYQRYELHAAKFSNTKEQYIVILGFNTDMTPIMGGLREGKESSAPPTAILTPVIYNTHERYRKFFLRASKSLHDHIIKL